MKEGENPGQKQLDKIYCESKSTCWINIWNKEGNIHTQNPNVAWEKETSKQLRKHGSKSSLTFYEKEDLKDVVKSCEITHDRNKPLI